MLRVANRTVLFICAGVLILTAGQSRDAFAQDDDDEEPEAADPRDGKNKTPDPGGDDDDDDVGDATPGADLLDGKSKPTGSETGEKEEKAKRKKGDRKGVRVRGRVFVRDTLFKNRGAGTQWQNDLAIASARVGLDIRKYGWLDASLEVELADKNPDLKDAYVGAKLPRKLYVQVGNFKRPISPIALEGLWNLPLIERGLISDDIVTATVSVPLNLGGRSLGAMVTYADDSSLRPRVNVGLFRARLPTSLGGGADVGDQADNLVRDVYVRAQIEPIPGFQVGGTVVAFTQARFADDLRTRVLGALDVTLRTDRFRIWFEGFSGRTPFLDANESIGALSALRVVGAPRFRDPVSWVKLVEPFVAFSVLDPSDEKQDNRALEIGGGIGVYFRNQIRLQLEYAHDAYDDEYPQTPSPMGVSFLDRNTVRLQLGVRLR